MLGAKAFTHLLAKMFGASNESRLQQVGHHGDISFSFPLTVIKRAHAMADLKTDIP